MNYKLKGATSQEKQGTLVTALGRLIPLLRGEEKNLLITFIAILFSAGATLAAPVIIARAVDVYIQAKNYHGILILSGILLGIYIVGSITSYIQTITMGRVGQRVLFNLRNNIFMKLQELPIAFFNQNRAGDLISRINNDTNMLNQFFAQSLAQFIGSSVTIFGIGIFILILNIRLGAATLVPAFIVLGVTQVLSSWVQRKNLTSLRSLGGMSAEIQESIENFKVMVAFNRLDYFREKFNQANVINYRASVGAGVANNLFAPLYDLSYDLGQLIVLTYGIYLITTGNFTVGLLIGFLLYANNFYNPLRQFASVWSSLQLALAGLNRISEVLALHSDMPVVAAEPNASPFMLEFKDVSFRYPEGKEVLRHVNLRFDKGKTYALVGPTGGGKTTIASLMARLYDPTEGMVLLDGRDIRSYQPQERTQKVGFILQEPFLFTGSIKDNILYGNPQYRDYSTEELHTLLEKENLSDLLEGFEQGLDTPISSSGDTISLGQKQLIAFMRAVLRNLELLILDEATANIDTVTEQLLDKILNKLPASTTKIVIAHRLNTINEADEIYFVNSGEVTAAGSMQNAVDMLLHGKRES